MQKDMTQGNPFRMILWFAVPLFIGSVFQLFYNMVDSIVVGKYVGEQALAAVGACSSPYSFVSSLILGFTNGASVIVAQTYGSGSQGNVRKAYITSVKVILLTGIVFTVVGIVVTRPLLIIMQTPADVIEDSASYMTIMCIGILATCLYNGMASFLRAVGNSIIPLVSLILSSVINVILDLIFVLAAGMSVKGVAIATLIAQLISGIYCWIYVRRKMPYLRFQLSEFKMDGDMTKEMIRIGLPAAFSTSVVTLSTMFIQRAVNVYGSTVMAAYTAGLRTEQICMCLAFSIGTATGIFCGQNIGANKQDRVIRGLHAGIIISLIYTLVMGSVMFFGAGAILRLFTTSEKVVEIGTLMVRITAAFSPALGFVFCFQHFLRNVSDVKPTVWMSFSEITARGVLPFIFSAFWGYQGIWWATPIGWSGSLLIGFLRYKSGKWKEMAKLQMETDQVPAGQGDNQVEQISVQEKDNEPKQISMQ